MQAELSKPHVYSSFMSAEDALLIGKSLVGIWELDKLDDSQTKEFVTTLHKRSPDGYILKPNMEGGGNNLYG